MSNQTAARTKTGEANGALPRALVVAPARRCAHSPGTVLHLTSSAQLGGAEWVVLDIVRAMRDTESGWNSELVLPAAGPLAERAQELGARVHILPWSGALARVGDAMVTRAALPGLLVRAGAAIPDVVRYGVGVSRLLRHIRPTVVHAHGLKTHLFALWTTPPEIPIVLHMHDYPGDRALVSRLLRVRPRRHLTIAAISDSVADDARTVFGRRVPIHVVHNAVDTDRWTPEGPVLDLDALAGAPPAAAAIRVGIVGTLARWKGHEVFLEALAAVPRTVDVRGYVIGGSLYETDRSQYTQRELRAMADRLGVGDRLVLTGFVPDPAAAIRALDVVVHASTRREPFGRVIIEAMALERPVITTALGGAGEIVCGGETALVTPPGDGAELARLITRLATSPDLRRRLGEAARKHVVQTFSVAQMIPRLADLYAAARMAGKS